MTEKVYRSDNACVTIQSDMLQVAYDILSAWGQVTYCVLGLETAPTTGTKHLQCYFEFKNTMRASTFWKKVNLPGSYFESRKGSQARAINYCKKGEQPSEEWDRLHETGPNFGLNAHVLEYGGSKCQGERTDLSDIVTDIQRGMKEHELSLKHVASFAKHMKWCQRMIQLHGNSAEHAQYTLYENCVNLQVHPVPFDHPDWIGSAAVGGNAGCGKTDYALSHFDNPLIVSHIDKLKHFNPKFHDGIVFDDMCFKHFPLSAQKHLLDWTNDREINVKHDIVQIPKHTRKIFTYNYGEFPFDESNSAIKDRLFILETSRDLGSHRKMPKPQPFGPLDEQFLRQHFM